MRTYIFLLTLGLLTAVCTEAVAERPAAKRFTLVIDAGHGGHDPGAVGKKAKEKDINLATALAFGRLVEANMPEVQVLYTRTKDVFVTLQGRAQIANRNKADLFVSIHTNAVPKGKIARGAETYTLGMARASANLEVAKRENSVILVEDDYKSRYQGFDPNSSESYIIFEMLQDNNMAKSVQFAKGVQKQFRGAGRIDKGVHQAGFLVLRETTMPGVLVELGYISTADEEQFLASKTGTDKMGRAIYNAFAAYYGQQSGVQAAPATEPTPESAAQPQPAAPTVAADTVSAPVAQQPSIVFRVQFFASSSPANASQYSHLQDLSYYKEGNIYKYTAGCFTTFDAAQAYRREVAKQYEGAFVVAFRDGLRIDINEARRAVK